MSQLASKLLWHYKRQRNWLSQPVTNCAKITCTRFIHLLIQRWPIYLDIRVKKVGQRADADAFISKSLCLQQIWWDGFRGRAGKGRFRVDHLAIGTNIGGPFNYFVDWKCHRNSHEDGEEEEQSHDQFHCFWASNWFFWPEKVKLNSIDSSFYTSRSLSDLFFQYLLVSCSHHFLKLKVNSCHPNQGFGHLLMVIIHFDKWQLLHVRLQRTCSFILAQKSKSNKSITSSLKDPFTQEVRQMF